jgi:hypothetical protein
MSRRILYFCMLCSLLFSLQGIKAEDSHQTLLEAVKLADEAARQAEEAQKAVQQATEAAKKAAGQAKKLAELSYLQHIEQRRAERVSQLPPPPQTTGSGCSDTQSD